MIWRRHDDRGTAAVELALVAPVLLALMFLVIFAGRVAQADADVRRAASEGARAASLRQHPAEAVEAAQGTVRANLAALGVACVDLEIGVDTSAFHPGGTVTVDVRCAASMRDVALIGVPGSRLFQSRAVEVVDTFRAEDVP
jgi:Flp pilus assembly protein TadG